MLAYLTAGLHILRGSHYAEALVGVNSREYHALALDAHHGAWRKIGHEEDALADELLRMLVEGGNA